MSNYNIGKDMKDLENRVKALENINSSKSSNEFDSISFLSETNVIQADIKVLDNCRHWWWKWNDFFLKDSDGRELLKVKGLTLTYTGRLDNDGNKDASVFIGGRIEDLVNLNWNLCMSVSIKTSAGVFVGIGVTDGAIVLKNTSYAVAGHGFPVDQTHANLWYDSIGPGLDLGDSPLFSGNGASSGIPTSCDSTSLIHSNK